MQDKMTGVQMQRFTRAEYVLLQKSCECDRDGNPYTQVCAGCGTPNHKVMYIPWLREYCEVPFMCECRLRAQDGYAKTKTDRERAQAQDRLRAALPGKYRLCTLEGMYQSKAKAVAVDFVEKWEDFYRGNLGLYIYGRMGVGKSYMAAAIANALIDRGVSVLFTDFTDLVNRMEEGYGNRNRVLAGLENYKLLVVDDYGCERGSAYMLEQIFSVMKRRLENAQPMIFTSNMPWSWVEDGTNEWGRINGRIVEMCVPVLLEGDDKRKWAQAEKRRLSREIRGAI